MKHLIPLLYLFSTTFLFVPNSYAQHCEIFIDDLLIGGTRYCDFYAAGSYRCAVDAYCFWVPCENGGFVWYACSLQVKVNGVTVVNTPNWIGLTLPWNFWYGPCFNVHPRDHVEIFVTYSIINWTCFGWPIGEAYLVVQDGICIGKEAQSVNSESPTDYILEQNYPNPFNPTTKIKYSIPNDEYVKLTIYNLLGEEVAILVDAQQAAGGYEVQFNAADLPSGIYIYRLQTNNFSSIKKLTVIK
jgi:hypothetical protein